MAITDAEVQGYDTILCIDASGSMLTPVAEGVTRWDQAVEFSIKISEYASSLNPDGITVITFGGIGSVTVYDFMDDNKIKDLLGKTEPDGTSNLTSAIDLAFKKADLSAKHSVIFVITDGRPTDIDSLKAKIKGYEDKLISSSSRRIFFIVVGDVAANKKNILEMGGALAAKFDVTITKDKNEVGAATANTLYDVAIKG